MKLSHVTLENFRAIEQLSLELGQRLTLLLGENGTGKTSVIDAISVGLGAAVTFLPNVSGISFKKNDPRIFENRTAPYTRKGFPKTHTRFDALAGAFQSDSRFKSAFIWFYNKENEELRLPKEHSSLERVLPELQTASWNENNAVYEQMRDIEWNAK
ncbi:ATP-binding protein [Thiomicrospira microaerophila]|uniref:ATP-binding protein n=1 Tax=Thiomicrospira microaerophila TaxID=406020 RepID=UPI0005C968AA|nr:ATP-binding protein [Thiomicrospira microaerophila]